MDPTDREKSVMVAVTFAEAGEFETARWYAPKGGGRLRAFIAWIERQLVAVAFAEAGLADEAVRLAGPPPPPPPRAPEEDALDALLRARGVRMFAGVLSPAALGARR